MGMPACTITSQTAHGGVVILGCPTVLIGMMPASRIGDNHVCPMVTGIVPHVGGPFILGSPTVLVSEMPQSRVTDQLTCVGPPDVAVMGCETVLVGMAGAAGAAGAAAGIGAMGAAVPMQPPPAGANSTQAVVQYDGTVNTWSPGGGPLPPIQLGQPGWPDLPAEMTANFQSVAPVTLPQGTQLFAAGDSESDAPTNFWSTAAPALTDPAKDVVKVLTVTAPDGMKAWAGQAAGQMSQAEQQAQQAVQQAQQNLNQAIQQAHAANQAAEAAVAQAQQQVNQATAQGKAAAQQALNQARQTAQQTEAKGAAAVQQAQQQLQQAEKQAQQAAQQGKQATGQAQNTATQVCTTAASTAAQTIQSFVPKKG